jgi:class 3 adenylate cyclase
VAVAAVPLVLLVVAIVWSPPDGSYRSTPAHFWLVLSSSLVAVLLGARMGEAARRRLDGRLFLVSIGFLGAAAFFGLHALATPGVMIGANGGFELAMPIGLVLCGVVMAVSSRDLSAQASRTIIAHSRWIAGGLVAVVGAWAAFSLLRLPPLHDPLQAEELDGWQAALGAAGVAAYAVAMIGYARLYRRRRARLLLAVTLAFGLLAEAMIVIAFASMWRIDWWTWHGLMLSSFALLGYASTREWHEERFAAVYLDGTLAASREASVVLADLQGFTSFSEDRSPEDVARMLNAYFGRLVPLMERARGDVHQIVGDELMVIFNQHGDQPDHGLRAARAALDLQREAEAIAEAHPGWPRFRVGVNTGGVHAGVVGGRGHRKHALVGDTVNLAARLEANAPAGGVLIGAATLEALPPGALVERVAPLSVKGKGQPVEAYVLRDVPAPAAPVRDGQRRGRTARA